MKTLLTLVFIIAMPCVGSGQGESDLRLRLCIDGRSQRGQWPPLRASEGGVVVCATTGTDRETSKVVTFIDDVLDTFSINGLRLAQGVLVDSTIFFAVYQSDSGVAEYDILTKDMLFYQHEEGSQGFLSVQISNFGSNLVTYDHLHGPTLVNTERRTLKRAMDGWRFNTGGWYEVFATEDSIFMLNNQGDCFINPIGTSKRLYICPSLSIWLSNVSIVGNTARWIDSEHTVWSYSRTNRTLDSFSMFISGEVSPYDIASVGEHGVLTLFNMPPFGELDTLIGRYHSFDRTIIRDFSVQVCGGHDCFFDFRSVGWSNGIFYLTVGSPDSMMCIYSYKEPEPVSSIVERDAKGLPASQETSVIMSLNKFDAWRRGLTSSYEMYDIYGNNITTSAIGVGVVFVVFDNHQTRVLVVP